MKSFIVIHHSLTTDGNSYNWGAIRKYHMSWRHDGRIVNLQESINLKAQGKKIEEPWADIGYHWGIEMINGTLEVLQGRPTPFSGAHCKDANMNQIGIGVCLIGDFDKTQPSYELFQKLRELVQWLKTIYSIPTDNIIGHREAQAIVGIPLEQRKTCPGKLFNLGKFRESVI